VLPAPDRARVAEAEADQAAAAVVEAEQRLPWLRRRQAEAARQAERDRKAASRWEAEAERVATAWLDQHEAAVDEVEGRDQTDRPEPSVRLRARQLLHDRFDQAGLSDLAERDAVLSDWGGLHLEAGRLLGRVFTVAKLAGDHPLVARADALECRCWRGVLRRVDQLAGEVQP
jgi:hypothetical protein